ncbi:MAG: ArnT family glycosyltransferase [Patescibacteria group bacterium]
MRRWLLVAALFIISLVLRLHQYSLYPQRGATSDEYAFAFLGLSLLTAGEPVSWSAIPLYQDRFDLTVDGLYFPLVKPYLDHPPLFGLLVGGWARLAGEHTYSEVKLATIRLLPVIFSAVTGFLVFLIGRKLFGLGAAIWSLMIYATAPLFVINSRVVVAESLMTTFLLLATYILVAFSRKITPAKTILLALISGLAILTKVLGIGVFLTVAYFLKEAKVKIKIFSTFILIFSLFVLIWSFYGWYFGGNLFWQIQAYQGSRELGAQTLLTFLTTPIIVNKVFYDGWYFWGLISLLVIFSDYRKFKFILIPAAIYLLLLLLSVRQTDLHGWYLLPLFPFFALAAGAKFKELAAKPNWLTLIFVLLVGIFQIKTLYADNFGMTPGGFRFLSLLLVGPLTLALVLLQRKWYRWLTRAYFYLFILGNVMITWFYVHPA